MNMPMCSRCKKNVAVVFITKLENGETTNDGICLKCAKELGIKPINDLMDKIGISSDDIDSITDEMMSSFSGAGDLGSMLSGNTGGGANDAADSMQFLDKLFGNSPLGERSSFGGASNQMNTDKEHKNLDAYAFNLTNRAREGKLDQVVGRESEILRVIQILNRRQKNNPCLIGEPGVGKTAVAEALAQRIASGNVPYKLRDKEVYLLDLTSLVAGTQFRGQFESRMKGLIDEVKALGNVILVIDEVHNLVGAGDAEGSMNAANILKPALSRGELQIIGATTFNEYRKHIEKDTALERRFQPVTIAEPSVEDAVKIILGIRKYYEQFHGVTIDEKVAREAVLLSERYITGRFLPDKAIDLIDEACSSINLQNKALEQIDDLKRELDDILTEEDMLVPVSEDTETYQRIADLKSRRLKIEEELKTLSSKAIVPLKTDDLAQVIELWTKIPASRVCEQEFAQLSHLVTRLKSRVVGQDEAIYAIASAIRRNRVGISPKRKPVSFMFVGPTGVGKTELVKCLASDLFDTPESLIRFDMSEFMEKHSVSKLIGSPPGYVGYDEAGQLTEKVRRRPYSIVLFDEIEKAHPDVLNIMLQILDDGHITDSQGRVVSFENTIIIMTSNAGSETTGGSLGFGRTIVEQGREKALKALSDLMRPEFINRIDEVIAFNHLTEQNFIKIAEIMLNDLRDSLMTREISFTYDQTLIDFVVKKSYSIKFGARNLRRFIQKEIEDAVASRIIEHYKTPISGIHITSDGENVNIKVL